MNSLTRKKALFYLLTVFLIGGISGAFIGHGLGLSMAFKPPKGGDISNHLLDRFQSGLNLSTEQVAAVKPLLADLSTQFMQIHEKTGEQIGAAMTRFNGELQKLLTPEQKEKFEAMERERKEWMRKHDNGPPPGPPREPRPDHRDGPGLDGYQGPPPGGGDHLDRGRACPPKNEGH